VEWKQNTRSSDSDAITSFVTAANENRTCSWWRRRDGLCLRGGESQKYFITHACLESDENTRKKLPNHSASEKFCAAISRLLHEFSPKFVSESFHHGSEIFFPLIHRFEEFSVNILARFSFLPRHDHQQQQPPSSSCWAHGSGE
jgi:hypothetical protein